MLDVYELMTRIKGKDWFLNSGRTELTRVDDNTIEIQTPEIKGDELLFLYQMDRVAIDRVTGAMGDKVTIVIEVQQ